MAHRRDEACGRPSGDSYSRQHPILVQTWIATESERLAQTEERDYDDVFEEVHQRVFAFTNHMDQLLEDLQAVRDNR